MVPLAPLPDNPFAPLPDIFAVLSFRNRVSANFEFARRQRGKSVNSESQGLV